jgi:hypothetical protein
MYLEDSVKVGERLPAALKPQERLDVLLQAIVGQSKDLSQQLFNLSFNEGRIRQPRRSPIRTSHG